MPTWREHAAPIIAEVIAETLPGRRRPYSPEERKKARKALVEAYPYGERASWPYKIWCSEVRRQLGEENKKPMSDLEKSGQLKMF